MIGARALRVAETDHEAAVRAAWRQARLDQPGWSATSIRERLRLVRRTRRALARDGAEIAAAVDHPQRRSRAETLSAEVLPLADACRFLERRAAALLRPRRRTGWGPLWLGGTSLEERREPLGVILVIGPANYPLFLPGVQVLQALAAGNAVLWKPGAGGAAVAHQLRRRLRRAGLSTGLLQVLPESTAAARAAIAAGVDKVVLTGSARAGRAVLADLAPRLIPATMELSGCDAVFVRGDADVELTAKAIAFGLSLNGGATCMAPRRAFVASTIAPAMETELGRRAAELPSVTLPEKTAAEVESVVRDALDRGARWIEGSLPRDGRMRPIVLAGAHPDMDLFSADLMAPVLGLATVEGDEEALAAAARSSYALAAAVFSRRGGRELAERVRAGVVVINDLIAPTADPRLAFGGRGESGFGLTRGAEGLLEMTALKTVVRRRTGLRPHLRPTGADDERALLALLRALHGGPGHWFSPRRARAADGESDKKSI